MALVVAACMLLSGIVVAARLGPFAAARPTRSGPTTTARQAPVGVDLRGTWHVLLTYNVAFATETLHVASQDRRTGVFVGTMSTPVGVGSASGRVAGSTVSFTFGVGTGAEKGTATVRTSGGKTTMSGTFSNAGGGRGIMSATLVTR